MYKTYKHPPPDRCCMFQKNSPSRATGLKHLEFVGDEVWRTQGGTLDSALCIPFLDMYVYFIFSSSDQMLQRLTSVTKGHKVRLRD
jgi:hypothetical protein